MKKARGYILILGLVLLSGCSPKQAEEPDLPKEDTLVTEQVIRQEDETTDIFKSIYEGICGTDEQEYAETNTFEQVREIVHELGEKGYTAVDMDNQTDMVCADRAVQFCEQAKAGKEAELAILAVSYSGGYVKYDLKAENEKIDVKETCYRYENSEVKVTYECSFTADFWNYTDEGYLMIKGDSFSEEMYVLAMSKEEEYIALRIDPLDEACRELNQKYIRPVGYYENNIFLTDWSEEDFGTLNFYDVFDRFYPVVKEIPVPYPADDNLNISAVYQVAKTEFEEVIMRYFRIDSTVLQKKTAYDSGSQTYQYIPRGFYDCDYIEVPYPEVVDYRENDDGTLSLTVNAVFSNEGDSRLFSHQVTVRPSQDGGFQYVSNHMLDEDFDCNDLWWHTERKADDESDGISSRTAEWIAENGGCVISGAIYLDMANYRKFDRFLKSCSRGKSGDIVLYNIHRNGGIGREQYFFDGQDMYVEAASVSRGSDGRPVFTELERTKMKEWEYTDKGWFCYELCVPEYPEVSEMIDASRLLRVIPMTEQNREMSGKCVYGIGYQGNNLFCCDWDTDDFSKIDFNGLYEYFYMMKYGKRLEPDVCADGIPQKEFEDLITEYLPINAEHIREYAAFDKERQKYRWERLGCMNYAPTFFGTSVPEVTDVKDNPDGTVTLTVDAVCDMVLCDDALITHELKVKFNEDNGFQYLGNTILNDGIRNIPEYQYRISDIKKD